MNFNRKIYLDNAATTQPFEGVVKIVTDSISVNYGNPSSTHSLGRLAKSQIEKVRKNIAKQLKVQASEIIFTSGGTEANNLILRGCLRDLGVNMVISSKIEHHAVLHSLEALKKEYSFDIQYVNVKKDGDVDIHHLEEILQKTENKKVLVSLMHVNNEIGNILPLLEVSNLCKTHKAYFHSDTVQSIGHFQLDLNEIPIDFITASAHKFHGLKGTGFAYIRKGTGISASTFGGEQEKGMRAGTESVIDIMAMGEAFNQSYKDINENNEYIKELKFYFIEKIKHHFPDSFFNGKSANETQSTYTIVNVAFPSLKEKTDTLLFMLDLQGVMCSKGSACQSGSLQNSHVLSEFLTDEELKVPSLRFSFSVFNTRKEIDEVISVLQKM